MTAVPDGFKAASKNHKNPDSCQIFIILIWITWLSTYEELNQIWLLSSARSCFLLLLIYWWIWRLQRRIFTYQLEQTCSDSDQTGTDLLRLRPDQNRPAPIQTRSVWLQYECLNVDSPQERSLKAAGCTVVTLQHTNTHQYTLTAVGHHHLTTRSQVQIPVITCHSCTGDYSSSILFSTPE